MLTLSEGQLSKGQLSEGQSSKGQLSKGQLSEGQVSEGQVGGANDGKQIERARRPEAEGQLTKTLSGKGGRQIGRQVQATGFRTM